MENKKLDRIRDEEAKKQSKLYERELGSLSIVPFSVSCSSSDHMREAHLPLVEALRKTLKLKDLATQYMVQGNTEKGMFGNKVKNPMLKDGKLLMDAHDSARRGLIKLGYLPDSEEK